MSSVCIVTDSSAQFTKPIFPGRNLTHILPLQVVVNGELLAEGKDSKAFSFPSSITPEQTPVIIHPSSEDFRKLFIALGQDYNEIVAVLISSNLSPAVTNAIEAAEMVRGKVAVQVIDSQSISVGLGYLVQVAADAAAKRLPSTEIERILRGYIPHVYAVFCIPGLTYLYHSGFLGQAQAIVGEMLNLLPIYTLEDGHLTSIEKARNLRQLMDYFQEFIDEFSDLSHIALVQGFPSITHEARILREHVAAMFPKTPFSEHSLGLPLTVLFGPHTLGLFAIEIPDESER
ncbi:MAG: DegV family EDD domain-containing protein [Chloroflexi bacterium]|nr:DegV family EDD domain-containing protein [Chloroflexota bacterium]